MRSPLLFAAMVLLLASCQTKTAKAYAKYLNQDSLPVQMATIDNTKDTVLTTMNGAQIHFPAGSLSAARARIRVREAYTIDQMILAGLTTESGGKPLQSGGMIYIDAEDPSVTVKSAIGVSIPTDYYDDRMRLYKGQEENGQIDWTDPSPIDSLPGQNEGRTLFQQNCAACHGIEIDVAGPALLGITHRAPWCDLRALFNFTRRPTDYMGNTYFRNLQSRFNGAVMPSFDSTLTDREINLIYTYLDDESRKLGYDGKRYDLCRYRCREHDSLGALMADLQRKEQSLIETNGPRIDYSAQVTNIPVEVDSVIAKNMDLDHVYPQVYAARRYKFEVKSFGWYNVDYAMNFTNEQCNLQVKIEGPNAKEPSVFIAVPNYRIFYEGGLLKNSTDTYGFLSTDGNVPLPMGTQVTVFTVGEQDGKIVFDSKTFILMKSQTVTLTPETVSKGAFNRKVRRFGFADLSITAEKTPNADEMEKLEKQMSRLEKKMITYLPADCDCHCIPVYADELDTTRDSTKDAYYFK